MTTRSATTGPLFDPPVRRLRLLANLATPAAVAFGLLSLWLTISSFANLGQLADPRLAGTEDGWFAAVVSLVLCVASALVAGLISYRLAVEVPRVVRGWEDALAERSEALVSRAGRSAPPR